MAGSPHCNWRNASPEIVCAIIISRIFWRLIWCLRKNIRTNLTYGVHTTKDHFNISITLFHQLTMMTFDMKFMRKYIVYIPTTSVIYYVVYAPQSVPDGRYNAHSSGGCFKSHKSAMQRQRSSEPYLLPVFTDSSTRHFLSLLSLHKAAKQHTSLTSVCFVLLEVGSVCTFLVR